MTNTFPKIVITGGAGLVGSHIVDVVVKNADRLRCEEVVVIDDLSRGRRAHLDAAAASNLVRFVEGDGRDRDVLRKQLDGAAGVFHQAAIRITRCAEDPALALDVLVNGTFSVIDTAREVGVKKIVAASSASVYGDAVTYPTDEDHGHSRNRTFYGAAKSFNEGMLRSFYEMYGLDYVALRYFNVYGPRMDIFGVYTEVIVRWLDCIDKGELPKIFGDGQQTMDFVFVRDVAEANLKALEAPMTDSVYNVGTGTETSLLDLWNTLKDLTGSDLEPVFEPERAVNRVRRRLASTALAKEELGFEAGVGLREGLRELIEWRAEQQ